jgi:hypothetical protein
MSSRTRVPAVKRPTEMNLDVSIRVEVLRRARGRCDSCQRRRVLFRLMAGIKEGAFLWDVAGDAGWRCAPCWGLR